MKPDIALLFLTLFSSSAARSAANPPRPTRNQAELRADKAELYRRRGGGGRGGFGKGRGGSRGGSSAAHGPQPSFVGGQLYNGGSRISYAAGERSNSGIVPFVLVDRALDFWPGKWLNGAYIYPYGNQYRFYNETSKKEETRMVICACSRDACCGCDDSNSTELYDELIGNGSYNHLNKSIVDVAEVNSTATILINGTLPNDTVLSSTAAKAVFPIPGRWPVAVTFLAAVFVI
jgi:hypothetical protein